MSRSERSKDEQVALLLRKTVENGATPGEEVAAVQLAHLIVRQHGLDLDVFKASLAEIGKPPRYRITADGFLVPVEASRSAEAAPDATPPKAAHAAGSEGEDACPVSPTRRHRLETYMRGTVATRMLYCVHCGARRESPA